MLEYKAGPSWPQEAPDPHAPGRMASPHRATLADGGVVWLVSDHDQLRLLGDDRLCSRALALHPGRRRRGLERYMSSTIVGCDGRAHMQMRRLITPDLTRRQAELFRPRVAAIADELMAALPAGKADLVSDLAVPLPVRVICEMLGAPSSDVSQFRDVANVIVADHERAQDEVLAALLQVLQYVQGLTAERLVSPAQDMLTRMIARTASDKSLIGWDTLSLGAAVLVGGQESTSTMIAISALLLLEHPDQLNLLRNDPALIPGAVEECLRIARFNHSVPPILPRIARQDFRLGDVLIAAGSMLLPLWHAANRDGRKWAEPDRFVITRPVQDHLAFGIGVHCCPGMHLARVELQEAVRALVNRSAGMRLATAADQLGWLTGTGIYALQGLPVVWQDQVLASGFADD